MNYETISPTTSFCFTRFTKGHEVFDRDFPLLGMEISPPPHLAPTAKNSLYIYTVNIAIAIYCPLVAYDLRGDHCPLVKQVRG